MTPQELKNSILQLAIQGRLVEQRPEDGTGEELYQQIQKEKQRLIKEGKIKKEKPLPEIKADEMPFEIPESWKWLRIKEFTLLYNGRAFKPSDWTEFGLPIVRIQNLNNPSAHYNHYSGKVEPDYLLHGGELLFAWSGTPGTSFGAHIWNCGKAVLNQHIFRLEFNERLIYKPYYKYALNQRVEALIQAAHGSAGLQHVTKGTFESTLIPLPPFDEQKRIVAKIEELLPLLDRYDVAWNKLEAFNKRFPDDLQKSVLQMAIQGKLVEQRPEEGTGEELYQQIQKEKQRLIKEGKIKEEKLLPEIKEDEVPFEVPEGWKWVKLRNCSIAIVDCPHSTPKYLNESEGYYAIDTNCINAMGKIIKYRYVNELDYQTRTERLKPKGNDIVYTREGSICRAAILPTGIKACLGQRVMLIRLPENILPQYIRKYLMAPQVISELTEKQRGIGAKHVNVSDVCNLAVPLPPLAEQKRIVEKLEDVMGMVERLKRKRGGADNAIL